MKTQAWTKLIIGSAVGLVLVVVVGFFVIAILVSAGHNPPHRRKIPLVIDQAERERILAEVRAAEIRLQQRSQSWTKDQEWQVSNSVLGVSFTLNNTLAVADGDRISFWSIHDGAEVVAKIDFRGCGELVASRNQEVLAVSHGRGDRHFTSLINVAEKKSFVTLEGGDPRFLCDDSVVWMCQFGNGKIPPAWDLKRNVLVPVYKSLAALKNAEDQQLSDPHASHFAVVDDGDNYNLIDLRTRKKEWIIYGFMLNRLEGLPQSFDRWVGCKRTNGELVFIEMISEATLGKVKINGRVAYAFSPVDMLFALAETVVSPESGEPMARLSMIDPGNAATVAKITELPGEVRRLSWDANGQRIALVVEQDQGDLITIWRR